MSLYFVFAIKLLCIINISSAAFIRWMWWSENMRKLILDDCSVKQTSWVDKIWSSLICCPNRFDLNLKCFNLLYFLCKNIFHSHVWTPFRNQANVESDSELIPGRNALMLFVWDQFIKHGWLNAEPQTAPAPGPAPGPGPGPGPGPAPAPAPAPGPGPGRWWRVWWMQMLHQTPFKLLSVF